MALFTERGGIVQRQKDGATHLIRPGRNGGRVTCVEVPSELAEQYNLADGDIVEGATERIEEESTEDDHDFDLDMQPGWDVQYDEPGSLQTEAASVTPAVQRFPTERLTVLTKVNGLDRDEAIDRPFARSQRSRSERTPPDRPLLLADGPNDATGRILDFAAPLGAGVFGAVYGPHGGGLTRTLQTVLNGIVKNAPDCIVLVLLLRPRAEEATEWRRRFPQAEIVVGSSAFSEAPPEQTIEIASLLLESAQRQTELGRDAVLMIDSLTALWGAMLEAEEADAQHEADTSKARQQMREFVQRAGCFHGAGPLGGGLGGTLTILGSIWHQAIDEEAEEERDTHPHLRLLEHLLPEASWLVALSEPLARKRLYPAIDIRQCRSQHEERLLPADLLEPLLKARGGLPRKDPLTCHLRMMEALDDSTDTQGLLERLTELEQKTTGKVTFPPAIL